MADKFLEKFTQHAKDCGLFFLIVLFGCWLANQHPGQPRPQGPPREKVPNAEGPGDEVHHIVELRSSGTVLSGWGWGWPSIPSILFQLAQGWVVLLSHKCHLLARCKSYKSIFKDVHSQGIVWWNIHIDPEVKFTAIYKKWLVKIPETRTKERTFRSDRSDWFTCH